MGKNKNGLDYWNEQLKNIKDNEKFGWDYCNESLYKKGIYKEIFYKELGNKVSDICKNNNLLIYTFLVSTLKITLSKYMGKNDIVIGIPCYSNKNARENVHINKLLPLVSYIDHEMTYLEYMDSIKAKVLENYKNQAYLNSKILVQNGLPNDVMELTPISICMKGIHEDKEVNYICESSKNELSFLLEPMEDKSIDIQIVYNSNKITEVTVKALYESYATALRDILNNYNKKIKDIKILSEKDIKKILYEFNDTNVDYPKDKTIHELFEAQVEKTPDNMAVIFKDKKLTYRELNERANSLARVLRYKGVKADSIVGIMVERSLEMIVGIMGILKSGGAYLPIDMNYPKDRIEYMLKNSECKVLLSKNDLVENLEFDEEVIDLYNENLFNNESGNLENINNSSNLAYIIYTSGTTGIPKGVMIGHRSLVNRLNWMQNKYPIDEKDTILQKTTYTFDVSVWEILWWSIVGAKVCMLTPNDEKDPIKIIESIDKHKVTTIHFVPSMLDAFLYCVEENRNSINLSSLRQVFSSGEALNFKQVSKFYEEFESGKKLINLYGPTEATIDVSYFDCANDCKRIIPIGKPIDNTKVYILNNNELVPIGVAGELYIVGDGLARGYVNRPELTAEKFIDNPFESGAKMYKTGDLARWLPDGNIEFLGRIDNQVKIRGFRIELGEIESNLIKHKYIKNAVVLPKEDNERNKYLVAYIETDKSNLEIIKGKKRYMLPNNMAIMSLNKNETDFMYKEIFEEQNYTKYGIEVRDGDCIFDIGANIGIFSLFINQINRNVKVYAFEPIPDLFDLLKINTELYNNKTKVFNYGISDKNIETKFTFYPKASIMSGKYSDYYKEKEVYTKTLINQLGIASQEKSNYDEIIEDRLKSVEVLCKLKTLSEVIKENNIKKIDLLKIDVEKSELDVLNGIDEHDWNKIKQIVLEVHDLSGQLNKVLYILEKHGYQIIINTESELETTNIYSVYAVRKLNTNNQVYKCKNNIQLRPISILENTILTKKVISEFLRSRIPEYMIPSYFVQLQKMPLTINGKLDRRVLPEPNLDESLTEYEAPRNETEETLAKIWSELLGVEKIGINDNFFDLGGHSLKATVLMSKIHKELNKEVPLKELFKSSTIKGLGKYIESAEENLYSKIEKVGEKEYYEASSAQERMYMLQQFNKDSIAYNMPVVFELEGKVDKNKIKETFRKLKERHEALRTHFEILDGKIIQKIENDYEFDLVYRNESENIEDIINKFVRAFDLEKTPLFRVEFVEKQENAYLLIDMHHIISDGVSMSILIKEFTEVYGGKTLEPLKLQYKDFAVWQNKFLKSEDMKKQEEYWINRFCDEIPVLNMPTDYERPAMQSFEGDSVSFEINEEVTLKLRKLTKETGTTMHMALLSVFNILLSKYSGQEDIVIGIPVAGRPHADLQNILGMFVNTLALRNKPERDKKYIDFLKEVKENSLNAYENQSYQLEILINKLRIRKIIGMRPLFNVIFNMDNMEQTTDIVLDEVTLKYCNMKNKVVKSDLLLTANDESNNIKFNLQYCTKLFNRKTIENMIMHFKTLLRIVTENKDAKIIDINMIQEDEVKDIKKITNNCNIDIDFNFDI